MSSRIMFLDLETQNHPYYGAISSPRHPDNYVVMHGQAIDAQPYDGEITGARYDGRAQWLHIPDDVWLLVAHNANFECDWMLGDGPNRDEFLRFLKRGGRVYCTAYGHYLLSRQQQKYPRLDEIAPMYGGTPKVDGVKILWEQGTLTSDIDPALLAEYLLGPEGDIANTRLVFWGQYQQLTQRGMWDMALERMEGQLYDAFCMDAGLKVDRAYAEQECDRLGTELDVLKAMFVSYRQNFPVECVFKETSDFHMSAWLYGGPVKYRARVPALDAGGNIQYVKADAYAFGDPEEPTYVLVDQIKTAQDFEACVRMYGSCQRFSRGKNAGQPKPFKVETQEVKTKWGELIYNAPGLVDLRKVLKGELYTTFMDSYTGKRTLADGTPVISTAAAPLELLEKQPDLDPNVKEVLRALLAFALIDKDLGTYYLKEELDDDGNVVKQSGMLQYLTSDDVIHHTINSTSTETTRKSAQRPNSQNFPRGDKNPYHTSSVKRLFVSRFGDDGAIIEADYTALEVVTLAALSQDQALINALVAGTDMHCLRLSKKLNETYDEVYEKCHNKDHPSHALYKQMRTDIKPPSFALNDSAIKTM